MISCTIYYCTAGASERLLTVCRSPWIFATRKRSLGQGNVFTPVCLFTGKGLYRGGFCIQEIMQTAPGMILRDTVNERAVRILL